MDFDNLMYDDRALSGYPVYFDFAFLTLTVLTTLRNSMSEKKLEQTVSEVRHESNAKIFRYVKTKNVIKRQSELEKQKDKSSPTIQRIFINKKPRPRMDYDWIGKNQL